MCVCVFFERRKKSYDFLRNYQSAFTGKLVVFFLKRAQVPVMVQSPFSGIHYSLYRVVKGGSKGRGFPNLP